MSSATEKQLRVALENAQQQLAQAKARTAAAEAALTRNDELHAAQLREKLGPAAQQLLQAQAAFERLKEESAARLREVEALWQAQVAQRDEALKQFRLQPRPSAPVCFRCGSTRILNNVPVQDRKDHVTYHLTAYVDGDPGAFFNPERETSELRANVCIDCGATELIAMHPDGLFNAYRRQQQRHLTD